jgi:formylglycine-generating enzyme required for sulfatase activity
MPEPALIQQQRELLRAFRQANVQRAKAEADAEERRKRERAAADAALNKAQQEAEAQRAKAAAAAEARHKADRAAADNTLIQARRTADAQLAEARKAQQQAQEALAQAGLQDLLAQTRPTATAAPLDANPAQELARCTSTATTAPREITASIQALLKWRQTAAARRRRLLIAGAVATVAVIVVVFLAVRASQQAIEAARWVAAVEAAPKADSVLVPAGEFLMGSTDADSSADSTAKPQHKVYLDAFKIDRTEVTNAMYGKCVQTGACQAPSSSGSRKHSSYYGNSQYANYPVIHVTWNDALAYCTWVGGRLPTEAEWEKAARGADGRIYPWGNEPPDKQRCNFHGDVGDTTPVGAYPAGASPYGALDMAGNVWEWVADRYQADYYAVAPARNPPGPAVGDSRVLRGGSWLHAQRLVRAAFRFRNDPEFRIDLLGFRCARSP